MAARLASLRDPGTPDQIVMEQHNLIHFRCNLGVRCASNPEEMVRHIETQLCLNFTSTAGTWPSADRMLLRRNRHILEPSNRRWYGTPRTTLSQQQPNGCVTWCIYSQHTENQPHVLQLVDNRSFDVCEETCTTIRRSYPLVSHG